MFKPMFVGLWEPAKPEIPDAADKNTQKLTTTIADIPKPKPEPEINMPPPAQKEQPVSLPKEEDTIVATPAKKADEKQKKSFMEEIEMWSKKQQ